MSEPVQISNIEIVETVPPAAERRPGTLYIADNEGKQERDRYLGAFMDRWSGLEQKWLMLMASLLNEDYSAAQAIFYSTTNIRTQVDSILGLITLRQPSLREEWETLRGSALLLSNNRNHLVHGRWIRNIQVDADNGNPVARKIDWERAYMTGDPNLNAVAIVKTAGEPKSGRHSYSLDRIRDKMIAVTDLDKKVCALTDKVRELMKLTK